MHCAETRLAPGLLSYLSGVRVVSWLLPQGTGAHSPFMPGDATAVFPGMLARAVVSRASLLVEYTAPALALAPHSDGSHVPPSSPLPLLIQVLSNNPCWCHRDAPIQNL